MEHDDDVVLAIDLGTGGPKVAYVTLAGDVVDHEHHRVEMTMLPDGGAVEDPEEWWTAVVTAGQELAGRAAVRPERIVAVACTGQWGSTVPVTSSGEAAGPCMLWLDQRGGELAAAQVGGALAVEGYSPRAALEWIRRAGGAPSPEGNDPLGHRLWIQHREPEVFRNTAYFMEPIDFLNLRLTGQVAATHATMTLSWLTDNRNLDRLAYDRTLLKLAGADETKLPPLRPVRSVVGELLPGPAETLGVLPGIPVVTGLPDLHTAGLGAGAVEDFHGHLAISTSAWVGCHTPAKTTSLTHQMATVPSALPGRYVLANNHETGGASMEWMRDHLIAPDDGLTSGTPSLAEVDEVAATVPSGSNGVVFAPWLKGERSPVLDTTMRASFLNVGMSTTRADMARALLEGVAYQLRWMLEMSEKVVGSPLRDLRLIGGGAQSDVWSQVLADVTGRQIHRVHQPLLANVRGAALFAGLVTNRLAVGQLSDRARVDTVFTPDPAAVAVHQAVHAEFLKLNKSQKGLYHRLNG
jgi:xylulokinase